MRISRLRPRLENDMPALFSRHTSTAMARIVVDIDPDARRVDKMRASDHTFARTFRAFGACA